MLTIICNYAASRGLPYEFVDWALDACGHDIDDYGDLNALAAEWWSTSGAGA